MRVLLAEDHALFRRGLRTLLENGGFEVTAEASNGRAAIQLAVELNPDVAIVDLSMPVLDGIQAIRAIAEACPRVRLIALTISTDRDIVFDALGAGADGFLLKDSPAEEILAGVAAVAQGHSPISPAVASQLVERLRTMTRRPGMRDADLDLTPREIEILRLVAEGKDNVSIAAALFLSPMTVKNHVHHILAKLGVENRVQAATLAVRHRLL